MPTMYLLFQKQWQATEPWNRIFSKPDILAIRADRVFLLVRILYGHHQTRDQGLSQVRL